MLSNWSIVLGTSGRSLCESTLVFPCPGKCLAHAIIPLRCSPCINAMPNLETQTLSSPKERELMTGFAALLFTSTSGAKSMFTPSRLHCCATAPPTLNTRSVSCVAPSIISRGKFFMLSSRIPTPHSASIDNSSGSCARCWYLFVRLACLIGPPCINISPPTW